MLHEHEEGRRLLAAMAAAVEWDDPARLVLAARAYVGLLREHIRKEDHCLFPKAAELLSGAEAESLWRSFQHVESDEMGEGTHERYLQRADDLADRLGVPQARVASACAHARCAHHGG
jgi:hemerythrin-like domain-containing protein